MPLINLSQPTPSFSNGGLHPFLWLLLTIGVNKGELMKDSSG